MDFGELVVINCLPVRYYNWRCFKQLCINGKRKNTSPKQFTT